ncbi:Methyl-CpG-binding domain-containing protein 9 [Sesamum alatum]|uniref:Methyl-CpG-binding domain-containing protein 9 n=1 Tax=Sesamum alatum TaxID=300844 RepID=A0AAE2CD43_9LAMI|nr:Methyl-CpG-binding domain-containing protein 9 [Sesamum alatum]
MEAERKDETQIIDDLGGQQHLLLGKPVSSELTPFLGDIVQIWRNVLIAFENDSQLVDLAKKSCRVFESLYDKELVNDHRVESFNDAGNEDVGNIAVAAREISETSWGEGSCKVCGIDENNKKVLMYDTCDGEYHTYCLRSPLAKAPKENWFCPFCGSKDMVQDADLSPSSSVHEHEKKTKTDYINFIRNEITNLAVALSEKDYWGLSFYEMVQAVIVFEDMIKLEYIPYSWRKNW